MYKGLHMLHKVINARGLFRISSILPFFDFCAAHTHQQQISLLFLLNSVRYANLDHHS